jgi:hypothetical protein
MAKYPHAIQRPSEIQHPSRDETRGIVIHWTAGHKAGDLEALNGPLVDVQFYVDTAGEVYQFLDSGAQAWHAMHTANHTCIGIEHEGSGEAWTDQQLEASAKLAAWLTKLYNIPLTNVDPPNQWHGFFGHKDLAGFEKNDHSDTMPAGDRVGTSTSAPVALSTPSNSLRMCWCFDLAGYENRVLQRGLIRAGECSADGSSNCIRGHRGDMYSELLHLGKSLSRAPILRGNNSEPVA